MLKSLIFNSGAPSNSPKGEKRKQLILLISLFLFTLPIHSLPLGGDEGGTRARYNVQIDFKKAYVSGICIMLKDEGVVKGSIVNEFGVSAIDFIYNPTKDKVKLLSVMKPINKWYIKKVLRRDLREVMHQLPQGGVTRYEDQKFHITYNFTPLEEQNETDK